MIIEILIWLVMYPITEFYETNNNGGKTESKKSPKFWFRLVLAWLIAFAGLSSVVSIVAGIALMAVYKAGDGFYAGTFLLLLGAALLAAYVTASVILYRKHKKKQLQENSDEH